MVRKWERTQDENSWVQLLCILCDASMTAWRKPAFSMMRAVTWAVPCNSPLTQSGTQEHVTGSCQWQDCRLWPFSVLKRSMEVTPSQSLIYQDCVFNQLIPAPKSFKRCWGQEATVKERGFCIGFVLSSSALALFVHSQRFQRKFVSLLSFPKMIMDLEIYGNIHASFVLFDFDIIIITWKACNYLTPVRQDVWEKH